MVRELMDEVLKKDRGARARVVAFIYIVQGAHRRENHNSFNICMWQSSEKTSTIETIINSKL